MTVIRILLSIRTCLGFTFGGADVHGAYMKIRRITLEVYVRPPRDFYRKIGVVWKVLKSPYGLVDAGRQWVLKPESRMTIEGKPGSVLGVPQFFTKKEGDTIKSITAKVTNEFQVSVKMEDVESFMNELQEAFVIGKVSVGGKFNFNGCKITVVDRCTELEVNGYLDRMTPVPLSRNTKLQKEDKSKKGEERHTVRWKVH